MISIENSGYFWGFFLDRYESVVHDEEAKLLKDTGVDGQRVLIFDRITFYAIGGEQTGDRGIIELDSGERLEIDGVQKYGGVWLHSIDDY